MTHLVTVSPIDPARQRPVLYETLDSLPAGDPVVVAFDAPRPGLDDDIAGDYYGNVAHLVDEFQSTDGFPNVRAYVAPEWLHQAGLALRALDLVDTDYVCFVEHDTPLVGDIPWGELIATVDTGPLDVIRLYHEHVVPVEHEYLHGDVERGHGAPYRATRQWSQRPHLARAGWYEAMLEEWFSDDDRTMIEDAIYGPVERGEVGKVGIYYPDVSLKRSGHLDGRGDRSKGEMVWRGMVVG